MKRFTKMLALGMAVALTLGMTVSASGNDPVNPSRTTTVIDTSEGIKQTGYEGKEFVDTKAAAEKAVEKDLVLNKAGLGSQLLYDVVDVFDLAVSKAGTVTYNTTVTYGREKEYGYAWGYAMIHFDKDYSFKELIKMEKDGNSYSAKVNSGSPFALVWWSLDTNPRDEDGNVKAGHDLNPNKGRARFTYQDEHTAARIAIENDGWGTVSAQYYNPQYVFAKTMGSVVMNLNEDSKVQFNGLDNLEKGEAYVVLCYNDLQNISGAPDRHFLMTDKVADKAYTVDLPKGEYAAVVIKVTTDATKVVTTPATAPEAGATPGTDAGTGTQTGGVVSPKTGEMLPFAVILAAICLAGAAVCAKKARNNA